MSRSTHRRRFLELCSTGLLAAIVGCVGDGDEGAPGATSMSGGDGAADAEMGFTPGGAQDVADFRNNVAEGYLPVPDSLTYEGLFSEYYFETGSDACESLFCAAYSPAVTPDPLSDERERYFTVGLDSGRSLDEFERPKVNLSVVLDVSGSMTSPFDRYYYDPETGEEVEVEDRSRKIDVAGDALTALTEQLDAGDRLGVVTFSGGVDVVHPIRDVGETDLEALRDEVRSIGADGSTNIEAGIREGLAQVREYGDADPDEYENRIVVLTDAQPNVGDTSAGGLRGTLESAAEDRIHATFVGVGLDFNPELVDRITTIRGANYYAVRSPEEFRTRMGEEFAFMVTPMAFDLSVELAAEGHEIVEVYGSSVDDAATDSLLSVPTLFPSPQEDGRTRGGVVLVQVESDAGAAPPEIAASWTTRAGDERSDTASVTFPGEPSFANAGVRKAVLLARYANLMRNWMAYERDQTVVDEEGGIQVTPEDALGRWEQTAEDLRVSGPYVDRIERFREHFDAEADAIGDDALRQELEVMATVLDAAADSGE